MKYIKIVIKFIINTFIKPFIYAFYKVFSSKKVNKIIYKKENSFFGYYNKCPWNMAQTKMLSLSVKNVLEEPDNISIGHIVLTDLVSKKQEVLCETHCWNTQQGCMLQWLGPDYESNIIFNDFENGKFVAKIYNVEKKEIVKILDMPVYDISSDGTFALSLDFTRLHVARPGYGYKNIECDNADILCPNEFCIWKIEINTGKIIPLIKYTDLYNFQFRSDMQDSFHKVNHIVINPQNNRFMFLHRWVKDEKKISRLITCDIDGKNMYNLSDDDMVSHCCWKNETEILGYLRKKDYGNHYYLLEDNTQNFKIIWKNITEDGHCTYDNASKMILSDTYPNLFGISKVFVGKENDNKPRIIAKFFSPKGYKNDLRCDLHPRWNHDGTQICVDAVSDGFKKIYVIDYKK